MIPIFVQPFTLLVLLACSTSGEMFSYAAQTGRARTAGNRFARDDTELGPQLGETMTWRTAS
jgi:hypothetical protein